MGSREDKLGETAEQYQKRLLEYIEGQDPLVIQSQTPQQLARLIRGASTLELTRRPLPDKWSIAEIIAHMAEDEFVSSWRYRQMVEQDGVTLNAFDQDLWATLGKYSDWPASEALELFRLLREANLRMLNGLSAEQWECSGNHIERGRVTVRALARHMAAHDINHLKQIEKQLITRD